MKAEPQPEPTAKRAQVSIWSYLDYRLFLSDHIAYKRSASPGFSVRKFCLEAQITTQNYVLKVIRGEKNLGPKLCENFIRALGLQTAEAEYFRALIRLAGATTLEQRDLASSQLDSLRSRYARSAPVLDHSILRHWTFGAIWELASCPGADLSPAAIASALRFKVSQQEIKEALEYLIARGYIVEQSGRYVQSDVPVQIKSGKTDEWIRRSHREHVALALQAVDWPIEQRGFFGVTLAFDHRRLRELKARMAAFMDDIQRDFALDPSADTVYRIHTHAFPLAQCPNPPTS